MAMNSFFDDMLCVSASFTGKWGPSDSTTEMLTYHQLTRGLRIQYSFQSRMKNNNNFHDDFEANHKSVMGRRSVAIDSHQASSLSELYWTLWHSNAASCMSVAAPSLPLARAWHKIVRRPPVLCSSEGGGSLNANCEVRSVSGKRYGQMIILWSLLQVARQTTCIAAQWRKRNGLAWFHKSLAGLGACGSECEVACRSP